MNLSDHTKFILFNQANAVTYIDEQRNMHTHATHQLVKMNFAGLNEKIALVLSTLNQMLIKRANRMQDTKH
jgi:hypothetical protein